ncbi:MAG: esterase/lipase family protein [Methylococcales bacterium]
MMEENSFGEFVILLHGLGRSRFSMSRIARKLDSAGYTTLNCGYPSTRGTIEKLVDRYVANAVSDCVRRGAVKIHVVTHSLGGILIRAYLQNHALPQGSRIVMLSPPNQGSEVVDHLKKFSCFEWILGPSAAQLGTGPASLPNRLERIDCEIGVIAGNVSSDPWFSRLIPGSHDGKVSVQRAKLDEMTDFLIVPRGHTFIMQSAATIDQILAFLQHGRFRR